MGGSRSEAPAMAAPRRAARGSEGGRGRAGGRCGYCGAPATALTGADLEERGGVDAEVDGASLGAGAWADPVLAGALVCRACGRLAPGAAAARLVPEREVQEREGGLGRGGFRGRPRRPPREATAPEEAPPAGRRGAYAVGCKEAAGSAGDTQRPWAGGASGPSPRRAEIESRERNSRARGKLAEFAARVGAPRSVATEAAALAESVTGGDWGKGRWVELLSAASTYAAGRLLRMPLSLPECAAAAQAPPHQIGAVCLRLIRHLGLSLPPTNVPAFLQRAVAAWPGAEGGELPLESGGRGAPAARPGQRFVETGDAEAERRRVLGDAIVLWEFGQLRGLDAGRNPLALGAAGLYLAASVACRGPFRGGLALDDVCELMHTYQGTIKERRTELVKELTEVSASFPIGHRVTNRSVTSQKILPLVLTLLRGLLPSLRSGPGAGPALPLEYSPHAKRRRSEADTQGGEGTTITVACVEEPGSVPMGLPPSFKRGLAEVERVAAAAVRVNSRLARWGLQPEELSGTASFKEPAFTAQSTTETPGATFPPAGRPTPPAGEDDLHLERLLLAGCSEHDLLAGEDLSVLTAGRMGVTAPAADPDQDVETYLRSDMQVALYHEVELLGNLGVPAVGGVP